jgi:hypothetical protein
MTVHFVAAYWPALIGLAVGALAGLLVARGFREGSRISVWDARATLPALLAAGVAHLSLIPAVELQRQVLFALYAAALLGVVVFALARLSIWRLGAVLFPLGSMGAYFYFGFQVHQVDYIGLLVKLVEVVAVVAALTPVLRRQPYTSRSPAA